MRQCDKCGTLNTNNAKYCLNCGYELTLKEIPEQQETQSVSTKPKGNRKRIRTIAGIVVGVLVMIGIQQFLFKLQTPTLDKALMHSASEINKSCPIMVDAVTRLDNAIAMPSNSFQYNYTIMSMEKMAVDTLQIKSKLEPQILRLLKTNPQMKDMRDGKVTMIYYYKDKNGDYLFQIAVTHQQYE